MSVSFRSTIFDYSNQETRNQIAPDISADFSTENTNNRNKQLTTIA